LLNVKEYVKPNKVEEAYEIGQMPNAFYVSGGLMVAQLKISKVEHLIDLKSLGYEGIEDQGKEIKIGANTKISALMSDKILLLYGQPFRDALKEIGSMQIRNMATVGGSIAFKLGWSDLTTIFMTLNSKVEFYDGSFRKESLEAYLVGNHKGAIITSLYVPKPSGFWAFEKFSKSTFDIATLKLGIKIDIKGKKIKDARIVVGSRPMISERQEEVENFLIGKELNQMIDKVGDQIEKIVKCGTDIRASAEYRKALSKALLTKAMRRVEDESRVNGQR